MSHPHLPPVPVSYPGLSSQRARLRLTGPDARRFLHGMVSNDVTGLTPGQGCHAAMLTVKGKLLGDLRIYSMGETPEAGLLIELSRACAEKVKDDLERHLIMDDALITDVSADLGHLGVYGEAAAQILGGGGGGGDGASALAPYHYRRLDEESHPDGPLAGMPRLFAARSVEIGIPGYHVFGPPDALATLDAEVKKSGGHALTDAEFDALRIEAGTPIYGAELEEDRMPAEANLDDAVSFSKGCYLGQEVVVRLRDRGHLNRRLCGVRFPDWPAETPPPVRGTRLELATTATVDPTKSAIGLVTSSTSSPRFGTIALAYIHRSAWEPGTELRAFSQNASGQPESHKAVVTALPFLK